MPSGSPGVCTGFDEGPPSCHFLASQFLIVLQVTDERFGSLRIRNRNGMWSTVMRFDRADDVAYGVHGIFD